MVRWWVRALQKDKPQTGNNVLSAQCSTFCKVSKGYLITAKGVCICKLVRALMLTPASTKGIKSVATGSKSTGRSGDWMGIFICTVRRRQTSGGNVLENHVPVNSVLYLYSGTICWRCLEYCGSGAACLYSLFAFSSLFNI